MNIVPEHSYLFCNAFIVNASQLAPIEHLGIVILSAIQPIFRGVIGHKLLN